MAIYQMEIIERNGRLVYKEVENDGVKLVMNTEVIELVGDVLRVYKEEELLFAVKLKPRVAAKLRKYMLSIKNAVEISVLWFELQRGIFYMSPRGADIKLWRLDLDEPDKKRQSPIAHIFGHLKRLFS